MSDDVIIQYDRDDSSTEDCIEVSLDRINPDTLRNMAVEFVTPCIGMAFSIGKELQQ